MILVNYYNDPNYKPDLRESAILWKKWAMMLPPVHTIIALHQSS
jgi:hypothetical protein